MPPKNKNNPNEENNEDNNQPIKKRVKFGNDMIFTVPKEKKTPTEQKKFELLIEEKNLVAASELVNKKSIDINKRNKEKPNYTLLQHYVSLGDDHLDTIKWLIENGAATNIKTGSGSTLLHRVSSSQYQCAEVINYLFKEKRISFNVKSINEHGQTPLHQAAKSGNVDAAKFLIEQHADINAVDNQHLSILYYAVNFKKVKMVEFLLQKNVNTEQVSPKGSIIHHSIFTKLSNDNDEECQIVKIINEKRANQSNSQLAETETQEDTENQPHEIELQKEDNKPTLSRTISFYNKLPREIDPRFTKHTLLKDGKSFCLSKENKGFNPEFKS